MIDIEYSMTVYIINSDRLWVIEYF